VDSGTPLGNPRSRLQHITGKGAKCWALKPYLVGPLQIGSSNRDVRKTKQFVLNFIIPSQSSRAKERRNRLEIVSDLSDVSLIPDPNDQCNR
jgi:hypothetical protein